MATLAIRDVAHACRWWGRSWIGEVPSKSRLKVTELFDSKTVAEVDAGVSLEALAEGAGGKGLIGRRREELESKLLHSIVHSHMGREEDLGGSDDQPLEKEQSFKGFWDKSENDFLLLCLFRRQHSFVATSSQRWVHLPTWMICCSLRQNTTCCG